MSQRITIGLVIVLCLFSVAATAMLWQSVKQGQNSTAALLVEIKKLADRDAAPAKPVDERLKYLEWIPVTVKLKDEAGNPVTEPVFSVEIDGANLTGISKLDELRAQPDENGVVDFGFIKPGRRQIEVQLAGDHFLRHPQHTFRPGEPVNLDITCSRGYFTWREKTLEIRWPEDLNEKELWTHVVLDADARVIDGKAWVSDRGSRLSVLIDPHGKLYPVELFHDRNLAADLSQGDPYPLNLLELMIMGEMKVTGERSSRWAWQFDTEKSSEQVRSSFESLVYADLSHHQSEIALVENGMQVYQINVLKLKSDPPADDPPAFVNILPAYNNLSNQIVAIELADGLELASKKWIYEPSDLVSDLVRKRLEALDADKPETAAVSKR